MVENSTGRWMPNVDKHILTPTYDCLLWPEEILHQ